MIVGVGDRSVTTMSSGSAIVPQGGTRLAELRTPHDDPRVYRNRRLEVVDELAVDVYAARGQVLLDPRLGQPLAASALCRTRQRVLPDGFRLGCPLSGSLVGAVPVEPERRRFRTLFQ